MSRGEQRVWFCIRFEFYLVLFSKLTPGRLEGISPEMVTFLKQLAESIQQSGLSEIRLEMILTVAFDCYC